MSCGVGHRHSLDPMLLWVWHRLAAKAPIQPLVWELPYIRGAALKRQKKKVNFSLINTKIYLRNAFYLLFHMMLFYPSGLFSTCIAFPKETFIWSDYLPPVMALTLQIRTLAPNSSSITK